MKSTEEFAVEIAELLQKKQHINMHKAEGRVYFGGNDVNRIDPELHIDKNTIRQETGRKIVRDACLDDLATKLEDKNLVVTKIKNDKLIIKTKTEIDYHNRFNLSSLKNSVDEEIKENPDFGNYYEP